ncbi:hypothetical protein L249_5231, partial [Ophiocordyceps polyrhachis-furcata BCC 54312]
MVSNHGRASIRRTPAHGERRNWRCERKADSQKVQPSGAPVGDVPRWR